MDEKDGFLTPAEVARVLRVHERTVRLAIGRGSIPAYRIKGCRALRIRLSDLQQALADGLVRPKLRATDPDIASDWRCPTTLEEVRK